ncbi:hypothetical protein BDN72DRAFT_842601 [Pluteus cervinus]|uniref:Uncharacterized protein n=1 Tax=Pluteus cervinus TaxID=181527 RepID=A0ACD3AQP2_9AGAR|nr:hypothetical protein BDN72DRAFT_842601 [Pluteus cervinus]
MNDVNIANRRAQLDTEIRDLEARLFSLRVERNALAPINQLPIEIFIKIFSLLVGPKDKAIAILPITWVTRHWRQIAVDFAELWSTLDNSNVKDRCIEPWLARSKTSSLHIKLLGKLWLEEPRFQTAFSQLDRITSLRISREYSPADNLQHTWTMPSFPSLAEVFFKNFTIPNKVFTSTASTRKTLLLERCTFDFAFVLSTYSALKRLSIITPAQPIRADLFLEGLAGMPNLKALILDRALTEPVDATRHVAMPNIQLESLVLRCMSTETQKWLIQQEDLICPRTMSSCSFLPSYQEHADLKSLVPTFCRVFSTGPRVVVSIDIVESPGAGYKVYIAYGLKDGKSSPEGVPHVLFSVDIYLATSILAILTYLNANSGLEHLRIIRIYRDGSFPLSETQPSLELPHSLAEFIGNLTNIQNVQLRAPFPFMKRFLASCADARQSPNGNFSILETVSIIDTDGPDPNFDHDPNRATKPIKTLILERNTMNSNSGEYDGFAERVVIAGTEDYLRLQPAYPVQLPRHPLESFDGPN